MRVLGLMSGTSLDGMDCALTRISGSLPDLQVELESFLTVPYAREQRRRIRAVCMPETSRLEELNSLNFEIGDWLADAALRALQAAGTEPAAVDLIASHGQTVQHAVGPEAARPATLQIGDPSVIAGRTGVTTAANFRTADVAAGGQGAPLTSFADWLLWRHAREARALLNIGGIANITWLPPGATAREVLAFDTGPGNLLIDWLAGQLTQGRQTCDADGRLAASGRVHEAWLAGLLNHAYFRLPPPKTTGRELFGEAYAAQLWQDACERGIAPSDCLATVTALTARSIALSLERHVPGGTDRVILSGGGGRNPSLVGMLRTALPGAPLRLLTDEGEAGDAKEAVAFAILGYAALHGRPGNLPSCTGAREQSVLGQIAPGRNFVELMRRVLVP